MANEIYTKEEIAEGLKELFDDEDVASRLLWLLSKKKLTKLINQYNEKHEIYSKRYIPIIKRNTGKEVDQYDVSNIMIKKINKFSNTLAKLSKNIDGYRKLIKSHNQFDKKVRINKIIKKIKKLFNLMES